MTAMLPTLAERLERAVCAEDSLEAERLRLAVRARLLDETVPETKIDRFVVLGRLGVGGMGVVYAAYDCELDRKIAIKLVRNPGGPRMAQQQERLLREARALAKLHHPNVVAIYDVGLHDDRVFIAMELVPGKTLRAHSAEEGTRWPAIVRAYLQAGEGLAAAHAAGLVHRDFKPDNALVADDGRVHVLDFGLARGDVADELRTSSAGELPVGSATPLTATGRVLGTPAYMAPEQAAGDPVGPKGDQFSFCVSLWEALHGQRPFRGHDVASLARQVRKGEIAAPPEGSPVPAWLRAVLRRGLAAEPGDRWPSMRALLDAIARDPRPRRRLVFGVAILAAAVASVVLGRGIAASRGIAACEARGRDIAPIWNDTVSRELAAAFGGTNLPYAESTADKLDAELSAWTESWAAVRERSCMAADVDGILAPEERARRDACLDEHADRLAALVDVLRKPDRTAVNHTVRAALGLPANAECEDDARLLASAETLGPTATRATVTALRRRLARAQQLGATGRRQEAKVEAEAALAAAIDLDDAALQAEATLRLADEQLRAGDYEAAARDYDRAYFAAKGAGADELALDAATQLIEVIGFRLARFDEAMTWGRHARVLLGRIGDSHDWRAASVEERVGSVQRLSGDFEAARRSQERALELRIAYAGPDHPQVGDAWSNLGGVQADRGDFAAAEHALAQAERILESAYGADSLEVVGLYSTRCSLEFGRGAFVAALAPCERALRIRETRLEPDHPALAIALVNLANVRFELGAPATARALLLRAIEIRRSRFGAGHPALASALANLGVLETTLGELASAEQHLNEALEIRRRVLPPGHRDLANTILNLADVHLAGADPGRARSLYEEGAALSAAGEGAFAGLKDRALAGIAQVEAMGVPRENPRAR